MTGLFGVPFYNRTTRKIVAAFGSLFDDITMIRYTKDGTTELERVLVPLEYGQKEKYVLRLAQDPELTRSIQVQLPRLSFFLTNMNYDPTRKQNQLLTYISPDGSKKTYKEVPYDFTFNLALYARNIEDGLQIVEQILPIFNPDYSLTLTMIEEMSIKKDVAITLSDVSYVVENEGAGADGENRLLVWEMNFVVKAWLFSPVSTAGLIKKANTYFYDTTKQKTFVTVLQLNSSNVSGKFLEGELVYQGSSFDTATVTAQVIQVDNVNRKLYVTGNGKDIYKPNTLIFGTTSGAIRNVSNYYITTNAVALSYITPNPSTANANSNYTYTIQISEWPYVNSSGG